MSDEFKLIKTAIFSSVTEVRFYDETLDHIQEEHPEVPILLPSIYEAVSKGLIQPTHIEASRTHANSYVFVDATSTNASGDPLRIPVRVVSGTSGRLTTVLFATGSVSATVIWRQS